MIFEAYAALLLALFVAGVLGALVSRPAPFSRRFPSALNHRGANLPVSLGIPLTVSVVLAAWLNGFAGPWSAVAGLLLVALAGFLDDWLGNEARGIRAHLGSLARGRFTTGILKIMAGFAAGLMAVLALGGSPARQLTGVILIAAATNLGNVLDVAPGRAVKFFLPVQALVLWGVWGSPASVLVAAALGAAVGVLALDLREAGMLGDAGSNPLGYLAGLGLYLALPLWALQLALGLVLVLQVLAETVTISRVIAAVPPLRWYDRVGRIPPGEPVPRRETKRSRKSRPHS